LEHFEVGGHAVEGDFFGEVAVVPDVEIEGVGVVAGREGGGAVVGQRGGEGGGAGCQSQEGGEGGAGGVVHCVRWFGYSFGKDCGCY